MLQVNLNPDEFDAIYEDMCQAIESVVAAHVPMVDWAGDFLTDEMGEATFAALWSLRVQYREWSQDESCADVCNDCASKSDADGDVVPVGESEVLVQAERHLKLHGDDGSGGATVA